MASILRRRTVSRMITGIYTIGMRKTSDCTRCVCGEFSHNLYFNITVAALLQSTKDSIAPLSEWIDLLILPGHHFRFTDALITNFHLPRTTLLMLVSAFAGRELTLHAYDEAIKYHYRFYSFGDAMLIF